MNLVGLIDYLVLNESEAELLTGKKVNSRETALEVTKEILDNIQCVAVVTTLGSQGAIVATNSGPTRLDHVPAQDVGPAIDTTVGISFFLCLSFILCISYFDQRSMDSSFRSNSSSQYYHLYDAGSR